MKSIKSRDRVSLEAAAEILALPLKGYLHILTRVYKRMHGARVKVDSYKRALAAAGGSA